MRNTPLSASEETISPFMNIDSTQIDITDGLAFRRDESILANSSGKTDLPSPSVMYTHALPSMTDDINVRTRLQMLSSNYKSINSSLCLLQERILLLL